MSCLSWRDIFHESWENNSKFQMGGLRKNGGLPLFSPEGRTYSPPVKQAVVCLRHRALSEGDFAFCGKRQTMPQHLRMLLSSSARLGKYRRFNRRYFPTACANLPPAALPQIQGRNNLFPPLIAVRRFSRRTCWNRVRPIMERTYTKEGLLRFTVALRKGW